MKISIYSYGWNLIKYHFDIEDALANWSKYANEIVIAINTSEDNTYNEIDRIAKANNYPVVLIKTEFDPINDPYYYGKVVDAAFQACKNEICIAQDFDERIIAKKEVLHRICQFLLDDKFHKAYFVPTIDLYGSTEYCLPEYKRKWYITKHQGLKRGPVNFGIKKDGFPDYNKTSTDEITDLDGNLVPALTLVNSLTLENLSAYVERGMPLVYHIGYLSLNDRLERSIWWKHYWEKATNGDKNQHPITMEELAKKTSIKHNLPLWK